MSDAAETPLFTMLVKMCGLPEMFATGLIRRALEDAGASVSTAGSTEYVRALQKIEGRMRAYLPPKEVEERVNRMRLALGH